MGNLLVDGLFVGGWTVERSKGSARLKIELGKSLPKADLEAVTNEGSMLLEITEENVSERQVNVVMPRRRCRDRPWHSQVDSLLGGQDLSHGRGDLGAEQFDGLHHRLVGHRPDRHLRQEALVAEELMLKENLLDHLLRASHQKVTSW
jgi:hypothetical protein